MRVASGGLRLLLLAAALPAAAVEPVCAPQGLPLTRDTTVIEVFHVVTRADGKSYGEMVPLKGSTTLYLGLALTQFGLGDPSNVVIVTGPPGFDIPLHPAPYREIFMVLSGSSTIRLSGGQSHILTPGSVVLFEDTTGAGHGGKVGPCGYVSLDLQFKPVVAAAAAATTATKTPALVPRPAG